MRPQLRLAWRPKLASLALPLLLCCLGAKAFFLYDHLHTRHRRLSWVLPAQAADAGKAEAEGGKIVLTRELLEKKDRQLRHKATELKKREEELQLLEKEIQAKFAQLEALQKKVASDLAELERQKKELQDSRIQQLAAALKAMEPAKAAKLLERLDEATVLHLIVALRGRAAGQILALMDPEKAARISQRLVQAENPAK